MACSRATIACSPRGIDLFPRGSSLFPRGIDLFPRSGGFILGLLSLAGRRLCWTT